MTKPVFKKVKLQDRTYHFPNGAKVELKGVQSINVSPSNTHRLNTKDGKKHIVPSGWVHIEFNAKDWSF
jgi:hypothetical protein